MSATIYHHDWKSTFSKSFFGILKLFRLEFFHFRSLLNICVSLKEEMPKDFCLNITGHLYREALALWMLCLITNFTISKMPLIVKCTDFLCTTMKNMPITLDNGIFFYHADSHISLLEMLTCKNFFSYNWQNSVDPLNIKKVK